MKPIPSTKPSPPAPTAPPSGLAAPDAEGTSALKPEIPSFPSPFDVTPAQAEPYQQDVNPAPPKAPPPVKAPPVPSDRPPIKAPPVRPGTQLLTQPAEPVSQLVPPVPPVRSTDHGQILDASWGPSLMP